MATLAFDIDCGVVARKLMAYTDKEFGSVIRDEGCRRSAVE